MRKFFPLIILLFSSLISVPALGSGISNFFTPYGFKTPLLEQGQYELNFNPYYFRQESRQDMNYGYTIHQESITSQYRFSLNGIYALTDALIFKSSLFFYPGQRSYTYRDVLALPNFDLEEFEIREHSYFTMVPGLQLSFRPRANIQFYGDFHFSKEKSYWVTEGEERFRDLKSEEVYLNLGFTILGRLSADKTTKPKDSQLFDFLKPYGFRAPVLGRGQYAVNLNSSYVRSESSWDQFSGYEWEKSIWRRYYFSLNGLYAVTGRLILQGTLDIYPAQTRVTYDREKVGTYLDYEEMRSDFAVFPGLAASLRPKINIEFYGISFFTRENLHKIRDYDYPSDVTEDYYYFDFGYTVLLKSSRHASFPIPESEFSNFFTPDGFRNPLLKQGQGILNINLHYDRTESEEHYPRSSSASDVRSTQKRYYFSLNGVYAVIDQLILECGLDVFPGQTRMTTRYTWYPRFNGSSWETTEKQHSHFTVSPRVEVSLRPQRNVEFYGAFYLDKEKKYMEERHDYLSNEYFYLDFGFTILGGL